MVFSYGQLSNRLSEVLLAWFKFMSVYTEHCQASCRGHRLT